MLYIAQLTNLEVLKINTNIVVTDELLSNLAVKCQQLTYVDITGKLVGLSIIPVHARRSTQNVL